MRLVDIEPDQIVVMLCVQHFSELPKIGETVSLGRFRGGEVTNVTVLYMRQFSGKQDGLAAEIVIKQ